jgi:hypothetical protein
MLQSCAVLQRHQRVKITSLLQAPDVSWKQGFFLERFYIIIFQSFIFENMSRTSLLVALLGVVLAVTLFTALMSWLWEVPAQLNQSHQVSLLGVMVVVAF